MVTHVTKATRGESNDTEELTAVSVGLLYVLLAFSPHPSPYPRLLHLLVATLPSTRSLAHVASSYSHLQGTFLGPIARVRPTHQH